MIRRAISALVCALVLTAPVAALEVRVKDVRAPANAVGVEIEIRDLLPDRFKRLIDDGGVLHLRVQAELWQSRPVWDRLVYAPMVRVFRLARAVAGRELVITDPAGRAAAYAALPNPMPLTVELGKPDRVNAPEKYYVRVVATLGTLAEREIDDLGDAVFGRASETNGLGSLGRMVFQKVIEISDYLQSVSAETRSRTMSGHDVLKP
jgi:hypothetical protein